VGIIAGARAVVPGSVVEWEEDGEKVIMRRAGKFSSEDIRRALFPGGPPPALTVERMDEAIVRHLRKRHARR
jgi:hypothetical protein